jgi:electron transport complex protein RnfG
VESVANLSLRLMLITLLSGAAMGFVNKATYSQIQEQKRLEEERARREALPQAERFEEQEVRGLRFAIGYAAERVVGYTILALGKGYSSTIETVVGIDTTGTVVEIEIIFQQETPGLGARVTEVRGGEDEPFFEEQFDGKMPAELAVEQDGGPLDSITGATISSRAVARSVKEGVEKLMATVGGGAA